MASTEGVKPKHYIDSNGNYLGAYSGVKVNGKTIKPKLPPGAKEVKTLPPSGKHKFVNDAWVEPEDFYKDKREGAYKSELVQADQLDAIYKYVMLTTAEKEAVVPDKTQPADTPEGWLGRVKDIKERFPKS